MTLGASLKDEKERKKRKEKAQQKIKREKHKKEKDTTEEKGPTYVEITDIDLERFLGLQNEFSDLAAHIGCEDVVLDP